MLRRKAIVITLAATLLLISSMLHAEEGWTPAGGSDGIQIYYKVSHPAGTPLTNIQLKFVNKQRKGKYARVEYQVRAEGTVNGTSRPWSSDFGEVQRIEPNRESTRDYQLTTGPGEPYTSAKNVKVDVLSVAYSDNFPN